MDDKEFENKVLRVIKKYQKGAGFTAEKYTDTPTDAFSVVPRKYVNMNGTVASRPASVAAVMGQHYYASDINIPLTYDSANSVWRNGVGSIIASN